MNIEIPFMFNDWSPTNPRKYKIIKMGGCFTSSTLTRFNPYSSICFYHANISEVAEH